MKMAWATPVFRLNVSSFFEGVRLDEFNNRLEAIVLNHWGKLQDKWGSYLCKGQPASGCDINNAFFHWQSRGGYEKYFKPYPEFEALEKMMGTTAKRYLQACGLGKASAAFDMGQEKAMGVGRATGTPKVYNATEAIKPWVTVHDECVAHLTHDHPETMVAGTYYVRTPPGAGALKLYDPRTMHQEHLIIHPRAGELVLFPGWLKHQVLPTSGSGGTRISIAFNFDGYWDATGDVGTSYGVPKDVDEAIRGVRYP